MDDIRNYITDRNQITLMLVANQIDQRSNRDTIKCLENAGQEIVTEEEGLRMAKKIRADKYCEVSALTKRGINSLFQSAAKIVVKKRKRSLQSGNIMTCISR